jgi:hypothetical protein
VPTGLDETEEQSFVIEFRQLGTDRLQQLMEGNQDDESLLRELIAGWEGVGDEEGNPLPCTQDNLARLAKIPYVRRPIMEAFWQAMAGDSERSRQGN